MSITHDEKVHKNGSKSRSKSQRFSVKTRAIPVKNDEKSHRQTDPIQCSATRKDGQRCRAWATADDPYGRCNVHAGRHARGPMWAHGIFDRPDVHERRERRKERRRVDLSQPVLRRFAALERALCPPTGAAGRAAAETR